MLGEVKFINRLKVRLSDVLTRHPMSPMSSYSGRRSWYDEKISEAGSIKNWNQVEKLLCKMSKVQAPSTWAITYYIARVVNSGESQNLNHLISNSKVREDHLPLLISAKLRYEGRTEEALNALRFDSTSSVVRVKMAQAQRSLYHQNRQFEKLAETSVSFMNSEPGIIFLDYAFNAAGSAEKCGREDLVAVALARLLSDLEKIRNSEKLQRKYWREAARNALKLFRISDAHFFLDSARKRGLKRGKKEFLNLKLLREDTKDWRWAINKARDSIVDRSKGKSPNARSRTPLIIVHSAAFSENKIDYPGFRKNIRDVYAVAFNDIVKKNIECEVGTKLSTHGTINLQRPYLSYHTISNNNMGVHFKETDRPHCFSFDPRGYSGWSSFSEHGITLFQDNLPSEKMAEAYMEEDYKKILIAKTSKYTQVSDENEVLPTNFVFVGLQIPGDAVQELCFLQVEDMLSEIVLGCKKNNISVVVKRHPYCKSPKITSLLREGVAKGDFMVSTGSIHDLIQRSMAVCVANSSVGAEALLYNKPVYVFGRSEYMQACYVCKEFGDFSKKFAFDKPALNKIELSTFWYVLRNKFSIPLNEVGSEYEVSDALTRVIY